MRRIVLSLVSGALMLSMIAGPVAAAGGSQTIAQIASGTGVHKTLVAALACTDLIPAVSGKGQLTVFAPTDAAFAKLNLNESNVCSIPKADLANILKYHVARGERLSGDVLGSSQIRMLNKQFAAINASALTIDGAKINADLIDIRASNGVIHVLNDVMLP